jgi:hypothetical protein
MEFFNNWNNMFQVCDVVLNIVSLVFIDAAYYCRCIMLLLDEWCMSMEWYWQAKTKDK